MRRLAAFLSTLPARLRSLVALLAIAALAVPLVGCRGVSVDPEGFAPASKADVTYLEGRLSTVEGDVAKDRSHVADGLAGVKADLEKQGIATTETTTALGAVKKQVADVAGRPPPVPPAVPEGTSPLGTILTGIGGTLLSVLLGYLGLKNYDRKPFTNADGTLRVSENGLVEAATALLAAKQTPKPTG